MPPKGIVHTSWKISMLVVVALTSISKRNTEIQLEQTSLDRICIEGIKVACIIGTSESERQAPQEVKVSIVLHSDLRTPCETDNIKDSIDYSFVTQTVTKHVESSRYYLIEALAESIARLCLSFSKVERVDVRVEKPNALASARSVAVEISRGRSE